MVWHCDASAIDQAQHSDLVSGFSFVSCPGVSPTVITYLPLFRVLRQQFLALVLFTDAHIVFPICAVAIQRLEAQPFLFRVFIDFFIRKIMHLTADMCKICRARGQEFALDEGYRSQGMISVFDPFLGKIIKMMDYSREIEFLDAVGADHPEGSGWGTTGTWRMFAMPRTVAGYESVTSQPKQKKKVVDNFHTRSWPLSPKILSVRSYFVVILE